MVGLENQTTPPRPISGNAYDQDLPQIPDTWEQAIDRFENSDLAANIFDKQLINNLVMTKRQELHYLNELSPEEQVDLYLDTV